MYQQKTKILRGDTGEKAAVALEQELPKSLEKEKAKSPEKELPKSLEKELPKNLERELPKSLGKKIKYFREQRGITQSGLAEELSVTRQAVSNWEREKTLPDVYMLQKIASFFGRTLDEFMEGTQEAEAAMPKTPGRLAAATGASILFYFAAGGMTGHLYVETAVIMVILWVFCQLFLHLIFRNAVKTGDFSALAGYDSKVEYHANEVKKVLIQMDIHVAVSPFGTVLLFGICAFLDGGPSGIVVGILVFVYCMDFTAAIMLYNYRSLDRTLVKEHDRKTAKAGMVSVFWLVAATFVFLGATLAKFTIASIENNSGRAAGYLGWMVLFLLAVLPEFFYEQHQAKKKMAETGSYQPGKAFWISTGLALAVTVSMFAKL